MHNISVMVLKGQKLGLLPIEAKTVRVTLGPASEEVHPEGPHALILALPHAS